MTMMTFPPHMTYELAIPIVVDNDSLDQADTSSSSDEEATAAGVQDLIRRTLASLEISIDSDDNNCNDTDFTFWDGSYDTDDSHDVTRRRWARNHTTKGSGGGGGGGTGPLPVKDTVIRVPARRLRRPVVHRDKALANLPGVPWPCGNQDLDDDDHDNQDEVYSSDDDELVAAAAEQTRQQTVDYFRSKVSRLSETYSVVSRSSPGTSSSSTSRSSATQSPRRHHLLSHHHHAHAHVSPDSVLTFSLAANSHGQQVVRKDKRSATTFIASSATALAQEATVTPTTPCRNVTTQQQDESHYSRKASSSPLRRGRRLARNHGDSRTTSIRHNHLHLAQHVERARASVIGSSSPSPSPSSLLTTTATVRTPTEAWNNGAAA
jgi:hypothetical protein